MLSQPRLPEEPSAEIIGALRDTWAPDSTISDGSLRLIYRALYAHLTKPDTKEVEVFRLEWARRCGDGWDAQCSQHSTREAAEEWAKSLSGVRHIACISVTGPHRQRVPA